MDLIDELLVEALKDEDVSTFVKKNNLSEEEVKKSSLFLYRYVSAKRECEKCKGLDDCLLESDGLCPTLKMVNDAVTLGDRRCKFNGGDYTRLDTQFFPYDLPKGDLALDNNRTGVYGFIREYLKDPKHGKGIYIHGSFGTGKTFIMINLGKKLSNMGVNVMLIHYPDFSRYIKMNVGSVPIEEIINACKYTDVLMFDDIGSEGASSYVRDDVLEPILQARMYMNKPVFFTSNLSVSELENHLKEGKDINPVAAARVCERIRAIANETELSGKSYR